MAISKIVYKEDANATPEVWMDTTDKTADSGNMLNGITALKNDGTTATGNIASKSSSDLTASGATVTAPAGYYASSASKSVSSGSATTPATTVTANPSISVGSDGLITATASATKSVTPTVSAGYVSSGTAGTITVSGSNTSQLTTQAAQTLYPSTTDQTISSGKYLTGAQTFAGVLLTNLSAGNIKKDVVVKVGDSADDDRITSVTGTYEGGGGGLEYETGTYTPAEDIVQPTIYFSNSHTSVPMMIMFSDTTGTADIQASTNYSFTFNSFHSFTGEAVPSNNTSSCRYGIVTAFSRGTSEGSNLQAGTINLSSLTGTGEYTQEYWATANSFSPRANYTVRYWRANRTYSWVAVWPPTT